MIISAELGSHIGETISSCLMQMTENVLAQLTSFEDKVKLFHPQMHYFLFPNNFQSSNYLNNTVVIGRGPTARYVRSDISRSASAELTV